MQVMALESDKLLLAPVLESGVGPNLSVRYSATDFVKGIYLIFLHYAFICLHVIKREMQGTEVSRLIL